MHCDADAVVEALGLGFDKPYIHQFGVHVGEPGYKALAAGRSHSTRGRQKELKPWRVSRKGPSFRHFRGPAISSRRPPPSAAHRIRDFFNNPGFQLVLSWILLS